MINQVFLYLGSIILFFWGVAHLFPTKSVVKGFGDITADNKRMALIFIASIICALTYIEYNAMISKTIYMISFIMLNILSVISLFTGFRIKFLPFKLCPVIFTTSSILILLGSYL